MRRRPSTRASDLAAALCVAGALISDIGAALADNAVVPDLPAQVGLRGTIGDRLALEAFVNGRSAKQIIEAHIDANNELSAPRGELKSIGLKVSSGSDDALIKLSSIPGLAYRYDEPGQAIYFDAPESMLAPKVFSATPHPTPSLSATSDIGVMINYDAYGASSAWSLNHRLSFGGASLSLDGRIFSPLGFISQSGVIGTTAMTDRTALRLDTTWQYDDEQHEISYRAGDFINSGLAWTRPIRMGGLQIARDFALRPDLVTSPLASASGTAAVPSSVDVLVNNFKVYTQDVDPGPFRIDNLPVVGDNGTTTLVMHDITGKEVTQTSPFFISSRLLAPGVFDYSVEGGYARTYYGEQSFSYAPGLIGSATLRGGLTDWATVEAHTEDGDGLINAGAGLRSTRSTAASSKPRLRAAAMTAATACNTRSASPPP